MGCVAALGFVLSACFIENVSRNDTDGAADGGPGSDGAVVDSSEACNAKGKDDTRSTAHPFVLGGAVNGCIGVGDDVDYYEFVGPSDSSGGYVSIQVDNITDNGAVQFSVENGETNADIFDNSALDAASISGFIGVVPGKKYRIAIKNYVGFAATFKYRLKLDYARVSDAYEPNDKRDDAKPITLGAPINAYVFTGFVENPVWEDWYKVTLASGTANIKIDNVPTDVVMTAELVDPNGVSLTSKIAANEGAALTLDPTAVTAGVHYVHLGTTSHPIIESRGLIYPDSFTRAYALTVSQ